MVPHSRSRIHSQRLTQRWLIKACAGLGLAVAAGALLPAHAAPRAATRTHKMELQQKIAEDKRELLVEQNKLEALLHTSPTASHDNAETQDSPAIQSVRELRAQLAEKRKHLAELQENYTDLYPDVITAREDIAELQVQLDQAQASLHSHPAPALRPQTTAARDQELAQLRVAIEERRRELARDEEAASRMEEPAPVHHPPALALPQETQLPAVPASPTAQPSVSAEASSATLSESENTKSSKTTPLGSRTNVLLLAAAAFLGLLGVAIFLLRSSRKHQAGIIQDSAQLRALLPDAVMIGSIPKMRRQ